MLRWVIRSDVDLDREIGAIADALEQGGIIAVPTASFYALAADVRCGEALHRVQRLKGRGPEKPLLALVATISAARRLAPTAPPLLEELAAHFWPGRLTLLLPAREDLAPPLVGERRTVAVRVPSTIATRRIAARVGGVTGTSANRTGEAPIQDLEMLELQTGALAGVVDIGRTAGGKPSTLLDITQEPARIVRHGALHESELRQLLGTRLV